MSDDPKPDDKPFKPDDLPIKSVQEMPKTGPLGSATSDAVAMRVTKRLGDVTNNKCPNCNLVNLVGVLVCENCGTSLIAGAASVPATRSLKDTRFGTGLLFPESPSPAPSGPKLPFTAAPAASMPATPSTKTGSGVFEPDMILRLEIIGASIPILVYPKKETLIGRRDVNTGTLPDVDLTSYAGYRMGVSRRHAIIKLNDNRLEVVDLGSSNGSRLNGVVMQAHLPFPLRDGDELILGKMKVRVIFQNGTQRVRHF
jgi:pSer/pThr/pTyr-binding forkhead associated (FHA) protein